MALTTPFDGDAPAAANPGSPLRLHGRTCVLESALGRDEVPAMMRWFADARTMRPFGRPARDVPEAQVRAWIARFDRRLAHLFVIRDGADRRPLGYATLHLEPVARLAWLDLSIGERGGRRSRDVMADAGIGLFAWVFETLGLQKMCFQIADSNATTRAWLRNRVPLEGRMRREIPLPDGGREDLLRYGLLTEEWPALKRATLEELQR